MEYNPNPTNPNPATGQNQAPSGQPKMRLKKVKRPVRVMSPQGPAGVSGNPARTAGTPTGGQTAVSNPFVQKTTDDASKPAADDAFNLDAFLDGEEKLPSVKNVPGKYNPRQPKFIDDEDELENGPRREFDDDLPVSDLPPYLTKKILVLIGVVLILFGMLLSKLLFSEEKVVRNGLQGVVVNPEVPRGRARCGVAEKTQGCVLYIMNPQRQELNARDFYDLAAQLTGRQRFVIETGNMRYSNTKIRPGDIAQLNIPPL